MAKRHERDESQEQLNENATYVCEEGKWQFVESHVGSLDLPTSGKERYRVDKNSVLLNPRFKTDVNDRGWRYWRRRIIPSFLPDMTVEQWLDELEKFDAASALYIPQQKGYKEMTREKTYRIMVDNTGSPISKEQFHRNMLDGAVKLSIQKHLQGELREKATSELYDELGVPRPVAGERGRRQKVVSETAPTDASEGMD